MRSYSQITKAQLMKLLNEDTDKTFQELARLFEIGELPSFIEKSSEFYRLIEAYAGELHEKAKKSCTISLINLGKKRQEILKNSITRFSIAFDNLQAACIKTNKDILSIASGFQDKKSFDSLKEMKKTIEFCNRSRAYCRKI
jgi:hypothetical protein